MRTRSIAAGDIVLVNKRGRLFYARVLGTGTAGGLSLEPLDRKITWRQATPREVADHWSHTRRDAGDRASTDQLAFDGMHDGFAVERSRPPS